MVGEVKIRLIGRSDKEASWIGEIEIWPIGRFDREAGWICEIEIQPIRRSRGRDSEGGGGHR